MEDINLSVVKAPTFDEMVRDNYFKTLWFYEALEKSEVHTEPHFNVGSRYTQPPRRQPDRLKLGPPAAVLEMTLPWTPGARVSGKEKAWKLDEDAVVRSAGGAFLPLRADGADLEYAVCAERTDVHVCVRPRGSRFETRPADAQAPAPLEKPRSADGDYSCSFSSREGERREPSRLGR